MTLTFARLGVPDPICRALADRGITRPFDIQAAAIADALAGRDVCGRAPTGSGKTLAFGIPLVANTARARPHRPRALVLAPTRELADQIMTELRSFSGKARVAVVYGGVGYGNQMASLRRGVDILVACPGRLEDLIEKGAARLSAVDAVVIDEADRMADMGFIPAVRRLLDQTAPDRQTMLFSATLDGDVASLTREYQHRPVRCEVGDETPDVIAADHVFWHVDAAERTEAAIGAISAAGPSIVFCRTRHGCNRLARRLERAGVKVAAIHGGRSQNQRTRALEAFATGRVRALTATDVAARGIHVEGVGSVIHYDAPADHKTYLHRSGRTARAGRNGLVVSFVQPNQVKEWRRMQRRLGIQQPITSVDLTAVKTLAQPTDPTASPEPRTSGTAANPKQQHTGQRPSRRATPQATRPNAKRRRRRSKRRNAKKRSRRPNAEHQPQRSRRARPARSRNRAKPARSGNSRPARSRNRAKLARSRSAA